MAIPIPCDLIKDLATLLEDNVSMKDQKYIILSPLFYITFDSM